MKYGLICKNIYDTYSPMIHKLLGNEDYTVVKVEEAEFEDFIRSKDFDGINLAGDYQKKILGLCDEVSELARDIGAANVVVRRRDDTLFADNTEYGAFKFMVENNVTSVKDKQCFILGSGGTSLSVAKALKDLGAIRVLRVSRRSEPNYVNIYDHVDAEVIVNTTPVGQYPNYRDSLINETRFQRLRAVYDLVCYPSKTQLMLDAMKDYVCAYGGLLMLVKQCADSLKIFNGTDIADNEIEKVYINVLFNEQNILLIGMEGCGHTAVGRELSSMLKKDIIIYGEEFIKKYGTDRKSYLKKFGETEQLKADSELINDITALYGKIICCCGELMSPKDNRFSMKRNSTVIWIERHELLQKSDGLSLDGIIGSHRNYIYRQPLYIESSDYNFSNNSTPRECAEKIVETLTTNRVM